MDYGWGCSGVFVFCLHMGMGEIHWREEGDSIINRIKRKTGKYSHLVERSWKIPFTYVSLIPGVVVVFSSYGCLNNGTRDNDPRIKD
jgi:hypothetical protein